MALGESTPFWLRTATLGGSAINKARRAVVRLSVVRSEDPGAAVEAAGPAAIAVGKKRIDGEVYGNDPVAIRALVGTAAGALVLGYVGDAAANEKLTLKNAHFHSWLGQVEIPDPDNPGGTIAAWGAAFTCEWLSTDTLALMWVVATDT